jgi:polysaccharide export outer membrane protein
MFAYSRLKIIGLLSMLSALALIAGCGSPGSSVHELPYKSAEDYDYLIGPGDQLQIFVWRNPELTQSVPVRPDGKISVPLVEDLPAADKTATQLAREIEQALSKFVRDPLVTVIVSRFQGVYQTQVRVVGQATQPRALPYRDNMTLLDVMIAVGGLTEFAAGNRSKLVRTVDGETTEATVRLEDLIRDGDISANAQVAPGDVIIIPEAWF